MGKRGPKPLSAEELAKRGSWRAKKRAAEEAVAVESVKVPAGLGRGVPRQPGRMTEEAKEIWDSIVPELDAMGLLTTADGVQLGELCSSLALVQRLRRYLEENGASYPVMDGERIVCYRKRPEVGILAEAQIRADKLASQFGLTPASRSRVEVTAAYTSTIGPPPPAPPPKTKPEEEPKNPSVIDGKDRFFRGG